MSPSPLQRELGKRHPFDSLAQEVSLNLVRTQDAQARAFCQLFEAHALTGPQYNVLRILRGHGGDGVSLQVVLNEMVTRMPDVSRLIDRLEAVGLATRQRTPEDRRVVLVAITPAGRELLARLDQPVLDLHQTLLGHLSRAELDQLNALLVKARQLPP